MTAIEVRTRLLEAGIVTPSAFFADADYKPPRADWLTGEFDDWFRKCLAALQLEAWAAENWDCDDFADLYAVLARICHRRTAGSAGTGLPVGILWFQQRQRGAGGHAINLAVTSDLGVVFPEPQAAKTLLKLQNEEKASAWLAKL